MSAHHNLPDRNTKTLTLVREIGFDSSMCVAHGSAEKVFFLGPQMLDGREEGAHATEPAIREFVAYWENQVQVAKDYLANGCNNKTHEWRVKSI
jgi:hypothetical protein